MTALIVTLSVLIAYVGIGSLVALVAGQVIRAALEAEAQS